MQEETSSMPTTVTTSNKKHRILTVLIVIIVVIFIGIPSTVSFELSDCFFVPASKSYSDGSCQKPDGSVDTDGYPYYDDGFPYFYAPMSLELIDSISGLRTSKASIVRWYRDTFHTEMDDDGNAMSMHCELPPTGPVLFGHGSLHAYYAVGGWHYDYNDAVEAIANDCSARSMLN